MRGDCIMKRFTCFINVRTLVLMGVVVSLAFTFMVRMSEAETWRTGTFSIVAYDEKTGELGVAVQSKVYHVGMIVAWAEAGVGAIATQSLTNRSFGPRGLELMRAGLSAEETLKWLLHHDLERENRQVGIVDKQGNTATHTGQKCMDWAGSRTGQGFTVQGNILANEAVVENMAKAFQDTSGEFSRRLLAALAAGQEAGGDKRGKQSAAILVVRPSETHPEYNYRYVDLRVEDHPDPIQELIRLYDIYEQTTLVEAHIHYTQMYEQQGLEDKKKAEIEFIGRSLRRALADPSTGAQALNSLAWFTAINDMFLEEALVAAQRAVNLEPGSFEILDTLAEVYFRLGNKEKAVETGKKALAAVPDDPYLKEQLDKFSHMK